MSFPVTSRSGPEYVDPSYEIPKDHDSTKIPVQYFRRNHEPVSETQDDIKIIPRNDCVRVQGPSREDPNPFKREVAEYLAKNPSPIRPEIIEWVEEEYDPPSDEEAEGIGLTQETAVSSDGEAITTKAFCAAEAGGMPKSSIRKRLVEYGLDAKQHVEQAQKVCHPFDRDTCIHPGIKKSIDHCQAMGLKRLSNTEFMRLPG